jgi:hypothetical protein
MAVFQPVLRSPHLVLTYWPLSILQLLLYITQIVFPRLSNFIARNFNKIVIAIYPARTIIFNSRSLEEISVYTLDETLNFPLKFIGYPMWKKKHIP